MSERLSQEAGRLAGKLAEFLAAAFARPEGPLAQNLAFLRSSAGLAAVAPPPPPDPAEPLARLAGRLGCTPADRDLLVFAGLPEEHEGYAAVLRTLHPRGDPRPSVGLAAQLFGGSRRSDFLAWLHASPVLRHGAVRCTGEAPFFERSLELADSLWPALHGCDVWPASAGVPESRGPRLGLDAWLASPLADRARRALAEHRACSILVTADTEEMAFQRALSLVQAAGRSPVGIGLPPAGLDGDRWRSLKLHALLRDGVLVLRLPSADGPGTPEPPSFDAYPDTAVVAGRTGAVSLRGSRPLLAIPAERLGADARRDLWRGTLTALPDDAPRLAARYSLEPSAAAEVAADLACLSALDRREPAATDVAEAVRARAAVTLGGGVKLLARAPPGSS